MTHRPLLPIMLIALLSFAGLLVGLVGDGYEDVLACAGLFLCLAPIGWALRRR